MSVVSEKKVVGAVEWKEGKIVDIMTNANKQFLGIPRNSKIHFARVGGCLVYIKIEV